MNINSRSVKITASRIETPAELANGSDVVLTVEGSVVKEEYVDNHDGTVDVVYHVKGVIAE